MKVTTLGKTILLSIACIGLGMAPTARAAHGTNFLDALQTGVSDLLANLPDDATAAQRRALNSASKTLDRNSRSLGTDLGLLANAATALNSQFSDNLAIAALENQAVVNYSTEAQVELNAANDLIGTNSAPRSVSNQLAQAQAALDRGNADSNSIPVRARAVAFALNKIRVATMQLHRLFKAPLSLENHVITITGRESDNDAINITLEANHTYTIPANGDEEQELGTWSYERTGSSTGTVTLTPNSPPGAGSHVLNLKFTSDHAGTLASGSQTAPPSSETIRGRFTIEASN